MNLRSGRNPVHVFLVRDIKSGPGDEVTRMSLSGMESCLVYYDIRLVERFSSRSDAKLVYHFVAPDAESVRYVARRHAQFFDTLWLPAGESNEEKPHRESQPVYVAIYNRRVSQETPLRHQVFVSEDGHRLLTFCALAEYVAEADETFVVRSERPDANIEWRYDIWRDCG